MYKKLLTFVSPSPCLPSVMHINSSFTSMSGAWYWHGGYGNRVDLPLIEPLNPMPASQFQNIKAIQPWY